MKFQMIMMTVSFVITVILAMIVIPILKKIKIGQIERDDGPQSHLKKQGTPTMGGIIFMISIIICVTISYLVLNANGKPEVAQNLLPILILTMGFGVIGFIDDFKKLVLHNTKGLSPKRKMLGLLLISIAYTLFMLLPLYVRFFPVYASVVSTKSAFLLLLYTITLGCST